MKDFDKDIKELVAIRDDLQEIKSKEAVKNSELEKKCSEFVKKHNNIDNNVDKLRGSIHNMLIRGVDKTQLMDLLTSKNKHVFGSGVFNTLKNHMSGKEIKNEFLNYNADYINKLQKHIADLESTENGPSLNNLFLGEGKEFYLIDKGLKSALKSAHKFNHMQRSYTKGDYVYIVILTTVKNKGSRCLVYNYRTYPKQFIRLLYAYIILEQLSPIFMHKKGFVASDYVFVVDKALKSKYGFPSDDFDRRGINIAASRSDFNPAYNFIQLVKYYINGELIKKDYQGMVKLINFLVNKSDSHILEFLTENPSIGEFENKIKEYNLQKIYNYLNRFLFVVSDLDAFIQSVKSLDPEINLGPQKKRGKGSHIDHTLTMVDQGFRDSMYNHNNHYVNNYVLNPEDKYANSIPKSYFSYKNIMVNIVGND